MGRKKAGNSGADSQSWCQLDTLNKSADVSGIKRMGSKWFNSRRGCLLKLYCLLVIPWEHMWLFLQTI